MAANVAELNLMDASTADMFIKLQLLDIRTVAHANGGATNNTSQRDDMVAMQQYETELRRYRARRGLPSDELPIPELEEEIQEEAATSNNALVKVHFLTAAMTQAAVLRGQTPDRFSSLLAVPSNWYRELCGLDWTASSNTQVQDIKSLAVPHNHTHIPRGDCLVCSDRLPIAEMYDCPCPSDPVPHRWCADCLEHLHRCILTDEELYPPRCCQHLFVFADVKVYLSHQLIRDFEAKKEELEDTNRIYCHIPACSAYIGDDYREGTLAHCPYDHQPTCIMCKTAAHGGDCRKDEGRQKVEELATQQHWQTCGSCDAIVELDTGCNHITCRCDHQFCYVCGDPWKSCDCPNVEELHIWDRNDLGLLYGGGGAGEQHVGALVGVRDCRRDGHDWQLLGREVNLHFDCDHCRRPVGHLAYHCRACNTLHCSNCWAIYP